MPQLADFDYDLPESHIAQQPLAERDQSRLLVYENGQISHRRFTELPALLPGDVLLVFNNTKVVRARLLFVKESGAQIEVFCLEPLRPHTELTQAMGVREETLWQCMIGNARKWKTGELLKLPLPGSDLEAELLGREGREGRVRFRWNSGQTWAEVLEHIGQTPLPPYIRRAANADDIRQYQTVYARQSGAVAAPTAGLHFSPLVFEALEAKGIERAEVTLHVGAGTFQPVEAEEVQAHPMHAEQVVVDKAVIHTLSQTERHIVAVGTTSMRLLESTYWFGVKIMAGADNGDFFIEKLYPYSRFQTSLPDRKAAFEAVEAWMNRYDLEKLYGRTEIMIMPGYQFRVCKGLVTNFHQPRSTLLMLVEAFIGKDWRKLYEEAKSEGYRFLSYGDSSLLWGKS